MVEGAPLPPSSARFASLGWSPLPAGAGRDEKRLHLLSTRVRKEHESAQANYQNARRLRRTLSVPEARLWTRLRDRMQGKPVFRRQHPMGPYVLDFYCVKAHLAIELDGISHDMETRPLRDARRDAWLKERGITVLRIPVSELPREIDETADAIVRMAVELSAPRGRWIKTK